MIEKQLRLFDDEVQNAVFATLVLLVCFLSLFFNFLFHGNFVGAGKNTSALRTTLIQQSYTFK